MTVGDKQDPSLPADTRALLDAVVAMGSDLDLHSVLERIVSSACRLTDARYGALGVVGDDGELSDFITSGMSAETREAIGALPRGQGILGLVIEQPTALRLRALSQHPASVGFPPGHPDMGSFLGVPVRVRGTVFGNLYLTEKVGGGSFTDQDETMVAALASSAGFVIENARLFTLGERRRQWLEASARIVDALHPPVDTDDAMRQIVQGARRVLGAVTVGVVHRQRPSDRLGHPLGHPLGSPLGHVVAQVEGREHDTESLVASLDAEIRRAEDGRDLVLVPRPDGGTVVVVPLQAHVADPGVLLVVLEAGRGTLQTDEAELLGSFADQASLALDRAQAIADRQELMLVTDRDRIARDLHDLVIQRLFATGLQLQATHRLATDEEVRRRLDAAVLDLDATIRDIRSTIFELQQVRHVSLRSELHAVVTEYAQVLGFKPVLHTLGPVDTVCSAPTATQVLAVLREALSNVARHAVAESCTVEVEATGDDLVLRVSDDGRGVAADRHESGLRNVRRRATDLGGSVDLSDALPHGTRLVWTVPLT